jgi:hypothetical protein
MRRFILGFVSGCALMLLFGFYIWHRPPLLRVPFWAASYTSGGTTYSDGEVYRTFFPSPVYFVRLPNAPDAYRWFAFSQNYRTVGRPGHPHRTLFGYSTQRTPNAGIRLGDPKLEEEWQVDYSDQLPRFSNAKLSAQITHRDSN